MSEETNIIDIKEVISNKKEDLKIKELIDKAKTINSLSSDYIIETANRSNIFFNNDVGLSYYPDGKEYPEDLRRPVLTRYSMGQLCTKVGVPASYIDKCIKNGRIELATDNVNSWLGDYDKSLFIREYNGSVRGIFSSKYAVCDSHEILGVLEDTIDLENMKIKGSLLNEERLHLRLVDRKPLLIKDGDLQNKDLQDLYVGVTIDSSDVGRSILTCRFFIYKQVCTNGMIVSKFGGTLFSQKHIGITPDEFREGLVAGLKMIPDLRKSAVDIIRDTKEKRFNVPDIRNMKEDELKEVLSTIKVRTSLTSDESATKVINLMRDRYGNTQWGFYNALTEVAQDFTLERRIDLENMAGNMLFA